MFTPKDKINELTKFITKSPDVQCMVIQNKNYTSQDVSIVMHYRFTANDIEITYNKWFVEEFESAKKMNLPGTEHHNQLVKGTGVYVISKKLGSCVFYGEDANDIVHACEDNRDLSRYIMLSSQIQR